MCLLTTTKSYNTSIYQQNFIKSMTSQYNFILLSTCQNWLIIKHVLISKNSYKTKNYQQKLIQNREKQGQINIKCVLLKIIYRKDLPANAHLKQGVTRKSSYKAFAYQFKLLLVKDLPTLLNVKKIYTIKSSYKANNYQPK